MRSLERILGEVAIGNTVRVHFQDSEYVGFVHHLGRNRVYFSSTSPRSRKKATCVILDLETKRLIGQTAIGYSLVRTRARRDTIASTRDNPENFEMRPFSADAEQAAEEEERQRRQQQSEQREQDEHGYEGLHKHYH